MSAAIDNAEALLFGDVMTSELNMLVSLRAIHEHVDAVAMAIAAQLLLQRVALVEDSQPDDPASDEHSADDVALQRIEAKLDLLTCLVGQLLVGKREAVLGSLRWSYKGLCVSVTSSWSENDVGVVSLPVAHWFPQQLELPVRVLAVQPGDSSDSSNSGEQKLWLAFEPLPNALAEALRRHIFRLHRRAIAEERRGIK